MEEKSLFYGVGKWMYQSEAQLFTESLYKLQPFEVAEKFSGPLLPKFANPARRKMRRDRSPKLCILLFINALYHWQIIDQIYKSGRIDFAGSPAKQASPPAVHV
jgi:hypothetical protein